MAVMKTTPALSTFALLVLVSVCAVNARVSVVDIPASRAIQNSTQRRNLGSSLSCRTGNPIDDCWRCDPNWHTNRKRLADCAIGFGRNAKGGKDGKIYIVTNPKNDDPVNPRKGTLRHAVIQDE